MKNETVRFLAGADLPVLVDRQDAVGKSAEDNHPKTSNNNPIQGSRTDLPFSSVRGRMSGVGNTRRDAR